MNIDMHFHSTASDGYSTQDELILQAKKRNLDFIALTDHDVVSFGFKQKCKESGIGSCDSVEISAFNKEHNKSLHLTFYAQEISKDVSDLLLGVVRTKVGLIEKQIDFFCSIGFDINKSDFYQFYQNKGRKRESLNKFDICFYMYQNPKNIEVACQVNDGKDIDIETFYQKFLKRGGEGFEKYAVRIKNYEITLEQCNIFREKLDGILSLAHPNVTFRKGGIEEFKRVLPYYIEQGVNAIEINAKADLDWIQAILEAKEKYGIYITFGSDNHQLGYVDKKHGDFGEMNIFFNTPGYAQLIFSEYRDKLGV